MSTINDGGPAFPPHWDPKTHPSGMALRDYFATHCGALGDEVSTVLAAELAATQGVAKPTATTPSGGNCAGRGPQLRQPP